MLGGHSVGGSQSWGISRARQLFVPSNVSESGHSVKGSQLHGDLWVSYTVIDTPLPVYLELVKHQNRV